MSKDFSKISDAYEFFVQHSDERDVCYAALLEKLRQKYQDVSCRPLQILDFGSGDGSFAQYLSENGITEFHYVSYDPFLKTSSSHPGAKHVSNLAELKGSGFDVIVSNHSLYYVDDLQGSVDALKALLKSEGVVLIAFASDDDALIVGWNAFFESISKKVPYQRMMDLSVALASAGFVSRITSVPSEISFADTAESRSKIVRFMVAEYAPLVEEKTIDAFFSKYKTKSGGIRMPLIDGIIECRL